jgi:hypothetical protein
MTLIVDTPRARRLDYDALKRVSAPQGTATWQPIAHARAVDFVTKAIKEVGFKIVKMDLAVARGDDRFFGTLDLKPHVTHETTLTVGVRNSIDKSLSFGLVCGERCLVCANLCFGSDEGIEMFRKRSGHIENDLYDRVKAAMNGLDAYRPKAQLRILHLKRRQLCYNAVSSIVLDAAFRKKIIGTSMLKRLVKEWDEPSYEEFRPRTAWSLVNALTHVIKDRQQKYPIRAAEETLRFQALCV